VTQGRQAKQHETETAEPVLEGHGEELERFYHGAPSGVNLPEQALFER
jgi:hypothetical protein